MEPMTMAAIASAGSGILSGLLGGGKKGAKAPKVYPIGNNHNPGWPGQGGMRTVDPAQPNGPSFDLMKALGVGSTVFNEMSDQNRFDKWLDVTRGKGSPQAAAPMGGGMGDGVPGPPPDGAFSNGVSGGIAASPGLFSSFGGGGYNPSMDMIGAAATGASGGGMRGGMSSALMRWLGGMR